MNQQTVESNMAPITVSVELDSVSGLPFAVLALDFERLKHKYTASSEAEMSPEEWDVAEHEYRRFLALKVFYPGVSLVPSKQVDNIWHAHILDTRAYREDCEKVFGRFIDHYPYFGIYGAHDAHVLEYYFQKTIGLYEQHFGQYPQGKGMVMTRCKDHACHVPTTCACRVPNTCK
jgi:hypothetical protein